MRAIQTAIDAGINLIDTAPVYGFGHSEEVVGRAIAGRRDQVVLATKVGLVWDRQQGELFFACDADGSLSPDGSMKIHKFLGAESVTAEVERSLKRLKTNHIDLIQTHWQDVTTPIEDTVGALLKLKQQGKVRAIGACNATVEQLELYRAAGALDTDQERYSMIDRKLDPEQRPWCQANDVAILAYSPMAHGLLTGKVTPDRQYGSGDLRANGGRFTPENIRAVLAMLEQIKPVAQENQLTLAQLVVAWTLARPGVTHALVGARRPDQAIENAVAGNTDLSAQDIARIDAAIAQHAPNIK